MLVQWMLKPPIYGAYTELFAGLSPDVMESRNGGYVIPFGRFYDNLRKDLVLGKRSQDEGGTGIAADFWDWCEEQVKEYI